MNNFNFPDFPWEKLNKYKQIIQNSDYSLIDLSIGSPVDSIPEVILNSLSRISDFPGYPLTKGTNLLLSSIAAASKRRFNALESLNSDNILPTIGSKEIIAFLPFLLNLNDKTIAIPKLAYPTYKISAQLAKSKIFEYEFIEDIPKTVDLVFLNSPNNPTGNVFQKQELIKLVEKARKNNFTVVSDECYMCFDWSRKAISLLNPVINKNNLKNIIVLNSLSKSSNLASYRAAYLIAEKKLVDDLLFVRKHLGLIMPQITQNIMVKALNDDSHILIQKELYKKRRNKLLKVFSDKKFSINDTKAGLYLWIKSSDGLNDFEILSKFATIGILLTPGSFYGDSGKDFVRISLMNTDENINEACNRIEQFI